MLLAYFQVLDRVRICVLVKLILLKIDCNDCHDCKHYLGEGNLIFFARTVGIIISGRSGNNANNSNNNNNNSGPAHLKITNIDQRGYVWKRRHLFTPRFNAVKCTKFSFLSILMLPERKRSH